MYSDSALGSGVVYFNGGTLSSDSIISRTVANTINVGGNIITIGNNIYSGILTFNGNIDLGNNLRQIITNSDIVVNSVISNGGIIKSGPATLTLSNINTYTGTTKILEGTLSISGAGNIYASSISPVFIAKGATLDISSSLNDQTIGLISDINYGSSSDNSYIILGSNNLRSVVNDTAVCNAIISGTGGFIKAGLYSLELINNQNYTGNTIIEEGSLIIQFGGALNNSSNIYLYSGAVIEFYINEIFNIINNQTINGDGSLYSSVSFNSGSILYPGNEICSMNHNYGSIVWNGGMTYKIKMNNATGSAGQKTGGWSIFNTASTLDLIASSNNQIIIDLISLSGSSPGLSSNFDENTNYKWLILDSGSDVTSFDPSFFQINTSNFLNLPNNPERFSIMKGSVQQGDEDKIYLVYSSA